MVSKKRRAESIFTRFTSAVAMAMGHAWVFIIALLVLAIWALSGPLLGFSDTWQLIINTSTTIITFLMVFIIQNTQNRDNLALNLKLDVIMRNMGIRQEDLLEAEDKGDEILESKIKKQRDGAKREGDDKEDN
ncbi:low affinity iron permease family protein [Candidatus Saccharibacteria bacterium]|nr:low affinity iron permease family protein [Candidatus Saccharibacteria bacterium]